MASSSDYQASSLDESEYLDAMPLHLSDQGAADDLDGFDFILDNVDEDSAAGSSAEIFDALLSNSTNSGGSSNDMHFDSIQEHLDGFDPTPAPKPSRHRRGKRERSASPQANRQFQMNGINFDPPARRQASHGDLSMMSMSSVNNTSHHHEATNNNRPAGISKSQYTEALRKLAMSMKQTQESREHVCKMKREYLTPAQQAALAKAKEELQKQNEAIQKVASSTSAAHAQVTASPVTPPQAGSSLMTAFFTGTQQSRKHLGNYMDLTNTL